MIHDKIETTEYQPYTYLIGWKKHNIWYYGSQYGYKSNIANPSNLWNTYFTSSKLVSFYVNKFGEPDVKQIRKVFDTKQYLSLEDTISAVRKYESKVLSRLKVVSDPKWLNKTSGVIPYNINCEIIKNHDTNEITKIKVGQPIPEGWVNIAKNRRIVFNLQTQCREITYNSKSRQIFYNQHLMSISAYDYMKSYHKFVGKNIQEYVEKSFEILKDIKFENTDQYITKILQESGHLRVGTNRKYKISLDEDEWFTKPEVQFLNELGFNSFNEFYHNYLVFIKNNINDVKRHFLRFKTKSMISLINRKCTKPACYTTNKFVNMICEYMSSHSFYSIPRLKTQIYKHLGSVISDEIILKYFKIRELDTKRTIKQIKNDVALIQNNYELILLQYKGSGIRLKDILTKHNIREGDSRLIAAIQNVISHNYTKTKEVKLSPSDDTLISGRLAINLWLHGFDSYNDFVYTVCKLYTTHQNTHNQIRKKYGLGSNTLQEALNRGNIIHKVGYVQRVYDKLGDLTEVNFCEALDKAGYKQKQMFYTHLEKLASLGINTTRVYPKDAIKLINDCDELAAAEHV